jgi:hypothetical protein
MRCATVVISIGDRPTERLTGPLKLNSWERIDLTPYRFVKAKL